MDNLLYYICGELEELDRKIGKGEKLSASEIEYADMLAHTKKNLLKGEEMMGDDYSNADRSYNSYARNGRSRNGNQRRDAMGRYSQTGYSRNDYSRDTIMEHFEKMLREEPDERKRRKIEKMMNDIESI